MSKIYFAQSSYYTFTDEKLVLLKTEALTNSEFAKSAEIKSELDSRELENDKVKSYNAELNDHIKAERYSEAAKVQQELNAFKNYKSKKDSLRLEIEKAAKEENFDKALNCKQQLLGIGTFDKPKEPEKLVVTRAPVVEVQKPKTEPLLINNTVTQLYQNPAVYQNTYTKPAKEENSSKFLLAYSAGSYAPFGIMIGGLRQRGVSIIASCRFSPNQFLSIDDAEIEDKKISNTSANWHYTGYAFYSYASYNLGLSFRMFGNLNKVSCHLLPTIGMSRYRYIYEFEKTESYTNTVNILDKDHSGYNFNFTPTLLLNFKFFNLHVGGDIGIPEMEESNVVFGAGFAF